MLWEMIEARQLTLKAYFALLHSYTYFVLCKLGVVGALQSFYRS